MSWPAEAGRKGGEHSHGGQAVGSSHQAESHQGETHQGSSHRGGGGNLPKTANGPPKPAAKAANTATTGADGLIGVTLRVSSA